MLRIATYDAGLTRRGPGLLLRDILRGGDAQIAAAAAVIVSARPDLLLLTSVDYDHDLRALSAFAGVLSGLGVDYPHRFAWRPNSGFASGRDLNGDGRRGQPEDAQGYGWFAGEGGLAILSRIPILAEEAQDFSGILWRDLPGALLPSEKSGPSPPLQAALAHQRLSSTAHWVVPVQVAPGLVISLLVYKAAPPVFDGPEDRNGRRNHDETALWLRYLDGELPGHDPPTGVVAVLGNANIDPGQTLHRPDAINALLAHPRLQDPEPRRPGAPGALETADWPQPDPGPLRVDYVLPDARLRVTDAGVLWPEPGSDLAESAARASSHRLVWVDVEIP